MSHAPSPLSPDDVTLRRELRAALGDAYHLDRELERGGMGRLFLATERGSGRGVVIKVLPRTEADADAEARFRCEVAVTDSLRHPHVLPVLAAGESEALLFYVMPHVADGSLRDRLLREGRLSAADVVRLLCEVAGALAHAHAHGVVHGDVKPENVLLDGGRALLADFGAARIRRLGRSHAAPVVGTPLYMSPEQAAGESTVDARSDVYSLAVVGFELLTGRPPFAGPSPRAVLLAHLGQPVPSLRARNADVPPALAAVLERALAKSPASRYASAAAFRLALASSLHPASHPAAARRAVAPGSRRRPAWQALAAGLLLPLVTTLGAAAMSAALLGGTVGAAGTPRIAAAPTAAAAAEPAMRSVGARKPSVQHLGTVVVRPRVASDAPWTTSYRRDDAALRGTLEEAITQTLEAETALQALDGLDVAAIDRSLDLRALAEVHVSVAGACPQQRAAVKRAA